MEKGGKEGTTPRFGVEKGGKDERAEPQQAPEHGSRNPPEDQNPNHPSPCPLGQLLRILGKNLTFFWLLQKLSLKPDWIYGRGRGEGRTRHRSKASESRELLTPMSSS